MPDQLTGVLELMIPLSAVLMPVFIIWIINIYRARDRKNRYEALVEMSKSGNSNVDATELMESLVDKKKSIDTRKSGVVTIFAGIGLFLFGSFGINAKPVYGAGLLVAFIGVGQVIAGYIYPNQTEEINKAVENFEKK